MVPIQASSLGRRTGCSRRYPGGTAYRSIFRTVSRASPNWRAASRSLILSTTTARRTRAYSSTVYTSQVFHKTERYGNVRWNQSPGGLVLLRQQRRSRGVYWSILTPALIRCALGDGESVRTGFLRLAQQPGACLRLIGMLSRSPSWGRSGNTVDADSRMPYSGQPPTSPSAS